MYAVGRPVTASLALVLALLVVGPLEGAQAHSELTETDPSDGVALDNSPGEVRLEFSGEIAPVGTVVMVTGPLGDVTDGDPEIDGSMVTQPVGEDAPSGDYAVAWRVTSADGHPISGEFDYQITEAGVEAQGSATPSSPEAETPETSGEDDSTLTSAAPDSSRTSGEAQATAGGTDRAANTAAAPAQGDESGNSGTALWVWGVLALALVTLGGLGAAAIRRR